MQDQNDERQPVPSRREALESLANAAKYIAPATLVLISGKSASASLV